MPYSKAKVYSDGSHYIAIPHTPRKKRLKKGVKIKRQVPVMEELEEETTPFDGGVQMNMFDAENKAQTVEKSTDATVPEMQSKTATKGQREVSPPRKELFEALYKKYLYEPKSRRRQAVYAGMRAYFKSDEEARLFVELNFERKRKNLIARRIRMTRKANLQNFDYFVTFTFDDKKHTEYSFRKKMRNCLSLLSSRKGWKYIGVWERSPEKKRLHFHGVFDIPQGMMPGYFIQVKDYNFKNHRRQTTNQNTYFLEKFGRNDFEKIEDNARVGDALAYIMKYMEKSEEKIVYSKGMPQYFITDIMDEDIVCTVGMEDQKLLLFDDFGCWDEGEYIGRVSKETIAKMPKAN